VAGCGSNRETARAGCLVAPEQFSQAMIFVFSLGVTRQLQCVNARTFADSWL
jgi:hypothetical protein